jgi:hypothetical protein
MAAPGLRLRPLYVCAEPSFPVLHDYFEIVYGPLIGPSSFLLARALARHVCAAGGPVTVCPTELAREVGLRAQGDAPVGKSSHLAKAFQRLAHHRLVKPQDEGVVDVSVAVPPLSEQQLRRLPCVAIEGHIHFMDQIDRTR